MGPLSIAREKCWRFTCLLVGLGFVLSLTVSRHYVLTVFGDLTQCTLLLLFLLTLHANIKATERRARLFWILMAVGCGLWLCAQMLWTYFEVFLRQEVPNPFIGDVVLYLHLVPMMGALAVQPYREHDEQVIRLGVLDLALLMIWWLYLFLFMVIPWQAVWFDEAIYGRSFDHVYFLEHSVFLICAAIAWVRSVGTWKTIYRHLLGASMLYALGSIVAGPAIDAHKYYTGSLYDIPLVGAMAWFIAMGLIGHKLAPQAEPLTKRRGTRRAGLSGLAMITILSLPIMAWWAIYMSAAPASVRTFRLMLTLAAMMLMGALIWIKHNRLDQELARANQELREDSLTDLLTGSRNRRFFSSTIEADVQQAVRFYSPLSSVQGKRNRDLAFYLIDSDSFKEVNDSYGHDVGDQLLVEMARRISSAIRHADVLIRWGGDEFLVISRYTDRDDTTTLATRVLNVVGGELFELKDGVSIRCTCSIGWAIFPWFVHDPSAVKYDEVLHLADDALYRAKKAGKNQATGLLPSLPKPLSSGHFVAGKSEGLAGHLGARELTIRGPKFHKPAAGDASVQKLGVAVASASQR